MVKMSLSQSNPLTKRLLIQKANSAIVTITAVAAFVTVFSLIASKTLISQAGYQNHIINAKKTAKQNLVTDLATATKLNNAYLAFVTTPQNVLGGNPNGQGANDGNNAKIILDALPPQYDFPALATSLEKLLTKESLVIQSISGTDQEITQQVLKTTSNPQAVAMPFQFEVTGSFASIQQLVNDFQSSTRPFQFLNIDMSVGGNQSQDNMTFNVTAQTYFQPAKSFTVGSEVIK